MLHVHPSNDPKFSWIAPTNGDGTFSFSNQVLPSSTNQNISVYFQDILTGDWNGDGKTDILHLAPNDDRHISDDSWVVLSDGVGTDLLATISNGLGGKTTITYEPSSSYPGNQMPFVVHTVSSITVDDGTKDENEQPHTTITNYTYEDGYYDFTDREFRGFGYVKQTNPPPATGTTERTTIETWFHQRNDKNCFEDPGPPEKLTAGDEDFKGRPCHTELRAPWPDENNPGTLLSETDLIWRKSPISGTRASFVKLRTKRTASYDDVAVFTQEDYTYYDPIHGSLRTMITSGTDAEDVTTNIHYWESPGEWLWRPDKVTITGSTSGKMRETSFGYEDGTGNMLWKEHWLSDGPSPRTNMTYDNPYGNVFTVQDARGNTTTTEYDETHTFPVKITYPTTSDNPTGS